MTEFTPYSALAGGALIGLAATLLMWLNGRIAGVSGIARLSPRSLAATGVFMATAVVTVAVVRHGFGVM